MQGLRLSRLRDTEPLGLVTRTGPQQLKNRLGFHRASEKNIFVSGPAFYEPYSRSSTSFMTINIWATTFRVSG